MSKAPGAVADYDGSGPWFKIHDWGELAGNTSNFASRAPTNWQ